MTRFSPIDLSAYPVADVLTGLDYEALVQRDRTEFARRWEARRQQRPDLPAIDTLLLDSDPAAILLQVGAYRELTLRAEINDRIRALTLAGAAARALDHIGMTYYRVARRVITPATGEAAAVLEDDETYRRRLALAPEAWSTAGPLGAYLFFALSASGEVLDVAAYSEDEGVALAPHVRVVILPRNPTLSVDARRGLVDTVTRALDRHAIRPLADLVTVELAPRLPFAVDVRLTLRAGASQALVIAAAEERVTRYCTGRLRWVGEDIAGPVWLIGRSIRIDSLAAAAGGGDPNILDVEVVAPATDVNAPHASYTAEALAGVGRPDFTPLQAVAIQHLMTAPLLSSLSVSATVATGGWS
jgi:phage-related baseplate assembly protein